MVLFKRHGKYCDGSISLWGKDLSLERGPSGTDFAWSQDFEKYYGDRVGITTRRRAVSAAANVS
jgi:hypothetical protein